ncbi:MAG: hypothetical protein ABH863_06455 [Candidatus Micrarchaeota archaeon]
MVLEGLFKKKEDPPRPASDNESENLKAENAQLETRNRFFKKIIEKYAAMINEYEEKTVPELKSLINRNDPAIIELKKGFLDELLTDKMKRGGSSSDYVFSEDFLFVADKVYKYCQQLSHIHSNLPVSFWLSMKEIMELQAADPFDRAILLCSLLRSFDAPAKIRVLELENNLIHPIVLAQFEGKYYLLDPSQKDAMLTSFSGSDLESTVGSFGYDSNKYIKSAYEFNDEDYAEY